MLQKYHGNGAFTPLVELELCQIRASVVIKPKKWDYHALIKTRAARYRTMLGGSIELCSGAVLTLSALMMGTFGQVTLCGSDAG